MSRTECDVAQNNSRPVPSPFTAPAYRIIRAQLIATVLATASCLLIDWVAAYSALLGGLTCVVPAAFMAMRLGKPVPAGASAAESAGVALTMAIAGKVVLTLTLFVVVFVLVEPLDARFYFGVLIALHGLYVIVPLLQARTKFGRTDRTSYGQ